MKPKNVAYLKSLANHLEPSLTVGKGEIDETLLRAVNNALAAHELIKVRILDTCGYDRKEVGAILAQGTGSELISTIGRIVILYKAKKEPVIRLPY